MKPIRIVCRQSKLSLLQAELVRQRINAVRPGVPVVVIGRSSRGDREQTVSLSALDGTDFFTEDIFSELQTGNAEIAVHSLKDMSAHHFFSHAAFAIPDRDDVRDVAIFHPSVMDKLRAGIPLVVGTCSPRREEMAVAFLQKALPWLGKDIRIETTSIRGNVETRLQQLHEGAMDATILAAAGLNRLLRAEQSGAPSIVTTLLQGKPLMLLPLIECVPAPCQGAIVAEANPADVAMVQLLHEINNPSLFAQAVHEKKLAFRYGTGCLQRFGVTTVTSRNQNFLYAAGTDENGTSFQQWEGLPRLPINEKQLFSTTDHMRSFFSYRWMDAAPPINQPHVFVANYKAIASSAAGINLQQKKVWASGTRTWLELARLGVWVSGSADGLGMETLATSLFMPLFRVRKEEMCIVTHEAAAKRWRSKGWHAVANYELLPAREAVPVKLLQQAGVVFWSSFAQYEAFGSFVSADAVHLCAGGETAHLLQEAGVKPVVFPTIKSFELWRKSISQSHSVA